MNTNSLSDGGGSAAGTAEDQLEIAALLNRYAYHFDRNEPDLVAELFTDDAVIDYGPEFPAIRGRDEIPGRIRPGLDTVFEATSHHISNAQVAFTSATAASLHAYVYAWHRYLDRSADGHLWGRYQVECRRTEDGWKMTALTLRTVATTDFHRERTHPAERRPAGSTPAS
ncbi:MAG: nuclear transport factor 2 family protein [Acidimicrobiia bacterium]|nr:nuclear transport factor 2 family protein [Acidimicrobiia bacterium]NNF08725.1 nuclear transport factor 2 family protein [Acidimicrobiia bacterium]